jgi:hypothetical protein
MSNLGVPKISGFTIVRNARKLEYPFEESVRSLAALCDEVIINCGDSTDDTREICESLKNEAPRKIRIIESVWERREQQGGFQLKHQSDLALAECRGDWCVYLQADECLHEADFGRIREAMKKADASPDVDGILSDYLHFYGNFSYQITGRKWYRREVRAFKNRRGISAFRDAQGFRKHEQRLLVIPSGARVFHYGYVRSSESLGTKSKEMSQWWGVEPQCRAEDVQLRRHVGLKRFAASHPAVMKSRIERNNLYFDPTKCRRVWDKSEIKNALTMVWESIVPYRIGEFRNYEIKR